METRNTLLVKDPEEHEPESEHDKKENPETKESSEVKERGSESAAHTVPPPTSPTSPFGLGNVSPLLEPARASHQSLVQGTVPPRQTPLVEHAGNGVAEGNYEKRATLQMLGMKFLRLAHRLGETSQNLVVAEVLYKLGLAEQRQGRNQSRVGAFSFYRASAMAEQVEATGKPLDLSCSIMVLGKSGVGKSATINSIFDEVKSSTNAFETGTKTVQDVVGTVQGIKVRMIDTPGLLTCGLDQRQNEKILYSVKRFIKKNPPDIILYLDRLDMQSRDFGDMLLLRTITKILGPSIWSNAIVVLTHAACAPPEGDSRTALSYELFVAQRSYVVQRAIGEAANDTILMNPVLLVENHNASRTDEVGQRILPNDLAWKPHLLLLTFEYKILTEADTILKLQTSPPEKPLANSLILLKVPLPSLMQSRAQVAFPDEQFNDVDSMDESSDSDDEANYDELPPFNALTRAQISKLSKSQKNAYFDELEYREKLFMKKQLKDEKNLRKLMKKMEASSDDIANRFYGSNIKEEGGGSTNQWLVRPAPEPDDNCGDFHAGHDAIYVERLFAIKKKTPLSFSAKVRKDKKQAKIEMDVAGSIKHGEGRVTTLSFESIDMQPIAKSIGYDIEKEMVYTLRSDTGFHNFRHNKTIVGLSLTRLDDALATGVKLEDQLIINRSLRLVMTGGAVTGRGDIVYVGSLEANLRDRNNPLARSFSTLGSSFISCNGELGIAGSVQTQIPLGRSSNLVAYANFNNIKTGKLSICLNTFQHLQIALVGLVPLIRKIVRKYQQMSMDNDQRTMLVIRVCFYAVGISVLLLVKST
ncbi:hypothetical protein MKW98_014882 [Papaver atlanticum]|uniref:AIG1-type G domain-containing protein n=1 Tax=Papaver atlanticum TaxID=357466 RepID=A0AAD4SH21_9MAGN|nr:hypothetical protein MKW98_014882 [Papaver atlanticum]